MNEAIRNQFPIIRNNDIAYLDAAATAQKPQCVIDALGDFYTSLNANPMRGVYKLSIDATDAYENARKKVAGFINASAPEEIIFTRNATESINLGADILSRGMLGAGDDILVATSEHHSNFLPWKKIAGSIGGSVRFLDCDAQGEYDAQKLKEALLPNTKVFAIAQVSNVFGRLNPIKEFARICHENGTIIFVDGSQSIPHIKIDVRDIDADFFAFSGHKLYGPMGIGVLYGRKELLDSLPPFLEGGEMIEYVSKERVTYAELPHKYEAGTVSGADAYALGTAIDFINQIGYDEIHRCELCLTDYALNGMKKIPHVNIIGSDRADEHHGIITFTVDDVHPHDIASIFADAGVCIRAGHHCAQPLHILLGIPSTARMSIGIYNNMDDIERFLGVLGNIRELMGYEQ